jgi:hypothetical protein
MAINTAVRLAAEPVRSLAFGSISGTYAGIGTSFVFPCRILFIQNLTDATLMFSFDGVNDHFPLPASGFLLVDVESNKTTTGGALNLPIGTRVYVRTIGTPTLGSVYVSTFYGAS